LTARTVQQSFKKVNRTHPVRVRSVLQKIGYCNLEFCLNLSHQSS